MASEAARVELDRDARMMEELQKIKRVGLKRGLDSDLVIERDQFEGDGRELVCREGEDERVAQGKISFSKWAAVEEAKKPENVGWKNEPDEESDVRVQDVRSNQPRWFRRLPKRCRPNLSFRRNDSKEVLFKIEGDLSSF